MEMIRAILPQLSLLVLIMVIAVGFVKKINIGFFSIGAAFLLALLGMAVELQIKSGDTMRLLKASDVVKGFSSSMFVTLVGVTFLFGMASQNGTLDLFSKKIVALVGKRTYLNALPCKIIPHRQIARHIFIILFIKKQLII